MLLELGNATPLIVEADADVEEAASKAAANAFSFAGQSCISIQRVYVARAVYDDFVARFLPKVEALRPGDPGDDDTDVGPVIDEGARERILAWIDEAKSQGADILAGGETTEDGVIRPTVLDEHHARDEGLLPRGVRAGLHGQPVRLASRRPSTLANGTEYGLQAGIFTSNVKTALAAGAALEFGGVLVERGADVPRRPDAVRRRQGIGQHQGGPALLGSRDDRGATGRPVALRPAPAPGCGPGPSVRLACWLRCPDA